MVLKILYLFIFCIIYCVNGTILNTNVERVIDLSTQLVKQTIKINAHDQQPFSKYNLILTESEYKNLAFISATNGNKKNIKIKEELVNGQHGLVLSLPSASPDHTIIVEMVFSKLIIPYPEEIRQNEMQYVKYSGQSYFYSPYKTKTQKTTAKLSGGIISFTQLKPYTETTNKIKFGPYEDIPEFANNSLVIHYENDTPFMTVNSLERVLEVSHWGNVAVKEEIQLRHTGARLKGSFSRYEFQKDGRSGIAAVKSYKTMLPASATEVYYRDNNGNISTSNMKIMRDAVELELRPRFPLFGGWKTQYVLGYNVPSYEYLYNTNDKYVLQMRFIDHIFDDMQIDKAVLKIILPEGATNIEFIPPYPVTRHPDELHHTYLDTIGRPVVILSKSNLVENHISDFQLKYNFSKISLLYEPLLAIAFIFVIFLVTIIFLRLDFSINVHSHKE